MYKANPKVLNKKLTSIYLEPIEEEDKGVTPKLRLPVTEHKPPVRSQINLISVASLPVDVGAEADQMRLYSNSPLH